MRPVRESHLGDARPACVHPYDPYAAGDVGPHHVVPTPRTPGGRRGVLRGCITTRSGWATIPDILGMTGH